MDAFVQQIVTAIAGVSEKQDQNAKLSSNVLDALSKVGERLESIEKKISIVSKKLEE